jgi:hypothetical protein
MGLRLRLLVVTLLWVPTVSFLSGCGAGSSAPPAGLAIAALSGTIHGGQAPVSNSHVHLLAASTSGYGSASTDLLAASSNASDALGKYVLTDSNGNFSIGSGYSCTSGQMVYVVATQGNPGLASPTANNAALAEMAVLGTCPGVLASPLTVFISEVTTVAAVYALAGYMTGPGAVSSATTSLSQTGMSNAFGTAEALINLGTGQAKATTAAGNTVPVAKINLLADVIASCINSDGGSDSQCPALFGYAQSGGTTGTTPADTVTALLNVAHNPWANVSGLAALAGAAPPYPSSINSSTLTDLTLAVTMPPVIYSEGTTFFSGNTPSVDAGGNVVFAGQQLLTTPLPDEPYEPGLGAACVFTPLGSRGCIYGFTDADGYDVVGTQVAAIDSQGNAWMANRSMNAGGILLKLNVSTLGFTAYNAAVTNYSGTSNAVAIDGSNYIYIADSENDSLEVDTNAPAAVNRNTPGATLDGMALDGSAISYGVNTSGGLLYWASSATPSTHAFTFSSTATGGLSSPNSVAVDSSNRVWVSNGNNSLSVFSTSSTGTSPITTTVTAVSSSAYTGGGLNFNSSGAPLTPRVGIAIDGASTAWVPNYGGESVSQFAANGTAITPAASGSFTGGYQTGCHSRGLAVDGSGNVWVSCDPPVDTIGFVEFLGAATPVATPILPGQLGVRP